jgi:hypothetical protein
MSWITAVWSMNAAACLTFAGFYFVVWCKQRQNLVYLLFSCSATAAGGDLCIRIMDAEFQDDRAI